MELIRNEKETAFNAAVAKEQNLIGRKINEARKAKRWTLAEMARRMEDYGSCVQSQAISKWENGDTVPNAYQMVALCSCLGIEDAVLYFSDGDVLNAEGRKKVNEYKMDLIASGKYRPVEKNDDIIYIRMPVSTLGASAGTGNFLDDENFELMDFPRSLVPAGAVFGIKVVGDSMEPAYSNGQLVWIKPTPQILPGDIGLFVLDGNGYIKLYDERDPEIPEDYTDSTGVVHKQPVLISINTKYSPIPVAYGKYLKVVGKVL